MQSFFPNCVKGWNKIDDEIRNSNSLGIFKEMLFTLIRPIKRTMFNIHDPIGIKYIFNLRIGLSPLKYHKYRHNFQDEHSGLCNCNQANEDSHHFLLKCIRFTIARNDLLNQVQPILRARDLIQHLDNLDLYLYGLEQLSEIENKKVIIATIKFIKQTGRFL